METVPMQLNVPKEMKDVGDAMLTLAADMKAKKGVAEIAGDALPKLLAAAEGMDKLGEEAKSHEAKAYAGLLAGQLMDILIG